MGDILLQHWDNMRRNNDNNIGIIASDKKCSRGVILLRQNLKLCVQGQRKSIKPCCIMAV